MNDHARRVALTYKKTDTARWLSHLDLIRTLELAIRRARLPVTFSQGFNPRPRISFGPPLPLGATSDAEIAVLRLETDIDPVELVKRLNSRLPTGIEIKNARIVPDSERTLQTIRGCGYLVRVNCGFDNPAGLAQAVSNFLAKNEVMADRIDKKANRQVNIRPSVTSIEIIKIEGAICDLRVVLSHEGHTIAKLTEVIQALSGLELVSIHREAFV